MRMCTDKVAALTTMARSLYTFQSVRIVENEDIEDAMAASAICAPIAVPVLILALQISRASERYVNPYLGFSELAFGMVPHSPNSL